MEEREKFMITYGSTTLTSYNTITKIEVYYYKSTSATSLSGGSWSTTKPTWESGKYIWQKIRTTYEGKLDNGQTFSESDPVNITGQQGATGISAYSYKLTVSDTIVSVSKNGTYSTNSVTFSATSKQGDGNVDAYLGRFKIETTADGITWTTQYTSSANESSKTYTIPSDIANIRCSLYQAGGTTVLLDITSVSIVKDGIDATGLKDSIPFYLASDKETGITIYDEGWSTARPALDATNKYLWVYYLSRYSDGTTDPELIEVSGDIATFENNGDVSPIYNTEVEINPIQDLNGFDHAWNGGDGKNLLVYPYSVGDTYTSHDVTFTIEKYPNGAVKDILFNGTASATTYFGLSAWASGSSAKTDLSKYTGQSLIISGGTNNARISVQYRLPNSTSNKTLANDAGTGATFTVPDASDLGTWTIFITISNGTVLNNVRVYPMLRLATETDGTYEPYENICPINGWDGVKIERTGKNLLGIKYPNRTNNGITFTVNGSEITANGTATANAWSCANYSGATTYLQYKNLMPPGQYMLTGGKSSDKRLYITGNYLNGKGITVVNDYGNGALYTLTDWAYIYPQVQITSGTTVENEVFNIQLEATTTTTEYEPYCGNTYEIDFPTEAGTIFKGKLIIDENGDGQLIQTHKSIILNNTNRNGYNLYSPNIRPYWIIDDKALFSSYIEANNHIYTDSCIISHSGVINSPQNAKVQTLSAYTTKVVYVILINITTQEAMDAYLADHPIQLVYELAKPVVYYFTAKQILALLKTNHIYANTGNTTVRYYDNQKVTEPYIDYSATSAFEYSAEALDKIDNLEIGGRNLLRMSSMSSQDASISNSNTDFTEYFRRYNGNASQHIFEKIADGVYQDTIALNTNGNLGVAFGRLVSEFNFDYNSEYTLSCWAKCTKENAHLDIGLSYYKNNDTWEWRGGTNPQDFKEINKWQFFKLIFKPDADTKAICYCFTVKGETNGTDSFTIRNCKLEKGNKPTDWTPAPEDVEEEVSTLRTDLQSQIDEKIQTFYQSTNPASSWTTTELRTPHDGDLWYYTGTTTSTYTKDNVYRYNASNNTWSVYSASGELFDKVDGKSTIFYGTTSGTYIGVETGDYLVDSTDGSSYRWDGSKWVKVTDYQTTITNAIDNIQIGGRNLALDSSLTGNIQKWNPTADRWIKTIKDGHECLMCEGSLNTTATLTVPLTINSESYGVVPYNGLQLVFSADVLLEDVVKGTTNFYLALYGSGQTINGKWQGATLVKNSPHMTGASIIPNELNGIGWTRVWYIFKYDDYNWTNYLRPEFYTRDFTGRVYVKNIKVEYGDYATDWTPAPEDVTSSIQTYVDTLQFQVDHMAEIYYGTAVPTLSNTPASDWDTNDIKDIHVDDLYYNTSTGYCYRFVKSGSTYSWVRIKDSDITAAATAASNANTAAGNAQTTADNANTLAGQKRRIFVAQPTPPYEVGDLWVEGSNGDIKKCKTARATGSYTASDWELASKYTDDTVANEANDKIDNLEIGGRNLLKWTASPKANGTYSIKNPEETDGWYAWNSTLGEITRTEDGIKFSHTSSSGSSGIVIPLAFINAVIGEIEYTLSFKYRTNLTSIGVPYLLRQSNGNTSYGRAIAITSSETEWQYFTAQIQWASTDNINTWALLIPYSNVINGWIEIQDKSMKLEKGSKATDWSPALEDTQADIDTALTQSNIALEQSVEYIVGTQTASTGTWTGVTTDIELKVGKTIAYKLPYAGNGNASLVLTLADGSTTNAVPVYLNTTRVTTHFGANSVINMTYDGQYWRASSIPNSNNYDRRQHNGAIKAKVAISKYHLIGGNSTGYQHINASTPFDFGYPILYASGDIEVNKTATSTYEAYPNINFTYTGTIQEGGANKMLWLKGSINGNLFTPASSNYLTTIIPTSDDDMYYIPLGVMTSATNGYFSSSNRIYGYVDDTFQPLDNAAVLRAQSAKNFATATYGLCDTEATTSEKIVECPNFVLFEGARIQIAFTYANTEAIPTLNINNTGAKNIKIGIVECSDANPLYWGSDTQIEFVYDGTDWIIQNAPMTLYGICSTEQNIAEKIVMCDGAVVCKGTIMYVSMNYSNTAANASLNVADIGAIIINANNEPLSMPSRFNWNAETNPCFTFDGQCWQMDNDTVSAYIADTNDNGIFIHPIDDMSSGWSIGSAIQLFKQNIDYIKLWIENTIAKIRIGREDQGHIILDNESVTINGVKNAEAVKELASFSPIGITFDDKTPYKIGNDETYVQFVDTNEDGVADSLEIVADNISFRNSTSIQNELNVLQNKTDKTSDSLQSVINELNDKDYETRVTQLETNAVERNKYININTSEPSITIATEQGQNNTSLKLQSDKLSFISNSNETAYMANDQMNIPTASITNLFMQSVDNSTGEVFEKIWVMRSNGHLSLKVVKRGE